MDKQEALDFIKLLVELSKTMQIEVKDDNIKIAFVASRLHDCTLLKDTLKELGITPVDQLETLTTAHKAYSCGLGFNPDDVNHF